MLKKSALLLYGTSWHYIVNKIIQGDQSFQRWSHVVTTVTRAFLNCRDQNRASDAPELVLYSVVSAGDETQISVS